MTKVYVASPFFNQEEIGLVNRVEAILKEKGLQTFLPMNNQMEHLEVGSRHWSIETFMNDLKFINCACKFTSSSHINSKRLEMKKLIHDFEQINPNIPANIFKSSENVNIETVLGVKVDGEKVSFLDNYDK